MSDADDADIGNDFDALTGKRHVQMSGQKPPPRQFPIAGQTLVLHELTVEQESIYADEIHSVAMAIHRLCGDGQHNAYAYYRALVTEPRARCVLISACFGEQPEWLEQLAWEDRFVATMAFIGQHVRFFGDRLALIQMWEATRAESPSLSASPASSATGTPPMH